MLFFYTESGFWKAVTNGQPDTVQKYMQHSKAQHWLSLADGKGNTALHVAAEKGYRNTLARLVAGGADVNVKNQDGHTPLSLALRADDSSRIPEMVDTLLAAGADVNATPPGRTPALRHALDQGWRRLAADILAKGADPSASNALEAALKDERTHGLAVKLLQAGAGLAGAGSRPAHVAAAAGNLQLLKLLKGKGADFAELDSKGQSLLHKAAAKGDHHCIAYLLSEGLDACLKDNSGQTPLHRAVASGSAESPQLLVKAGADVNATDDDGRTPLHIAASMSGTGLITLLLKNAARPDIADAEQRTPAAIAAQNNNPAAVQMLEDAARKMQAKEATPLTAGVNAIPANEGEEWVKLGDHQVARVGVYPVLGRRLTEIFNFESRGLMIISENLKTGAESVTPLEKFEDLEESHLAKAIAAFRSLGGKVDEAALTSRTGKKPAPGISA